MCPRERLALISISTALSFAKKGLGHLLTLFVVFITCTLFLCFIRKLLKIRLLSIYRDFLLLTTSQHLLILVGIDTPIIESTTIHPQYLWVITGLSPLIAR